MSIVASQIAASHKVHQKIIAVLLLISPLFLFNIGSSQAAGPNKPSIPTNLSVIYNSGSYLISWADDASTTTSYELKWQRLENGHWKWKSHGTPVNQGDTSSWVLTGVERNDIYRFSIRALNGRRKSSWTDWLEVSGASQNNLPVAYAGPDLSAIAEHLLTLDGSASTAHEMR